MNQLATNRGGRGGKRPVFLSRRQGFGFNSVWWIGDLVQRATHSSGTTLKQSWLVVLAPNLSIVLFQTNVVPTSCFICILLFVDMRLFIFYLIFLSFFRMISFSLCSSLMEFFSLKRKYRKSFFLLIMVEKVEFCESSRFFFDAELIESFGENLIYFFSFLCCLYSSIILFFFLRFSLRFIQRSMMMIF